MTSIREIASRARVSIGTVDRVLHKRGRVSDKTRDRVERIVRELDYRPNVYARNLSLARVYRFAVLMPRLSQDSGYWRLPAHGILKAQHELQASRVLVQRFHFDRYSSRSFEKAFHAARVWHPDGVLIAPVFVDATRRLVADPSFAAPVVYFDSDLPGTRAVSAIGQDSRQSGVLAGHLMRTLINGGGTIAVVRVMPEDFHINERVLGFGEGINGSKNIAVKLYEVDSHKGVREFQRVCAKLVEDNRNLCGVFISNAWTHPVATLTHTLLPRRRIAIIGYDLVRSNGRLLKEGLIDFLVSQRPAMQGYEGVYALYRSIVLGERVPRRIIVPLDILTRDNVRYYED
jgi:LacI family transcriptional regulator, galactose operon repressor